MTEPVKKATMVPHELEKILKEKGKDIVTGITLSVKDIGGHYGKRPVEEIHGFSEKFFHAQCANILRRNFQPLIDFAEMVAKDRAQEHFKLHELLRAGLAFKKVMFPILVEHYWEDRNDLVKSLILVDRSVDRFLVNLAQVFVHYAKDYAVRDPLEFPVWVDPPTRKQNEEDPY